MFVRWTVHDFIIGLLWLCVCVCVGTHCPRALSIHAKISSLSPHFFCIFFLSCHFSCIFSTLSLTLLFSYLTVYSCFYFSSYHSICLILFSSHLISSCLISSLFLYSYLFLFHLICSFLILSHIVSYFPISVLFFLFCLNSTYHFVSSCLLLCPYLFLLSFHFI